MSDEFRLDVLSAAIASRETADYQRKGGGGQCEYVLCLIFGDACNAEENMGSLYKEFVVNAPPEFVCSAIRDVGAVHARPAQSFVTDTTLTGDVRTGTFANGFTVGEQIVSISDDLCRLAYSPIVRRATDRNGSFEVFPAPDGQSRELWVTDFSPDDVRPAIAELVELGSVAIQKILEESA